MTMDLLEIQPRELKFTFELKKQSSCQVQLVNNSDQFVAFKVKTTSPKKYCVRPNTGVILPKSTCDFTVTMQAQRVAPPDMQCKDKFLIQSTVVSSGTKAEEITTSHFIKDNVRFIEENKLKVVLVSPPHSPVLLPINGSLKQEPVNEHLNLKEQLSSGVENLPPSHVVSKDFEVGKDFEVEKDVEEFESKIKDLESKLNEAEKTIMKLKEEKGSTIHERDMLQQELAVVRTKPMNVKRVRAGFPPLFVCFVALVSIVLGYMFRV